MKNVMNQHCSYRMFFILSYSIAFLSFLVDKYYRFSGSYYYLKSTLLFMFLVIAIKSIRSANQEKAILWLMIPPGLFCSWWFVKFAVVVALWAISGFAP